MRDLAITAHVAAMFAAFAALQGAGLLLRMLAGRLDGRAACTAARTFAPVFQFGAAAIVLGALIGLGLAAEVGFTKPWLLAAYVVFVLEGLNGGVIEGGWARRLASCKPEAIAPLLAEPLPRAAHWVGLVLWAILLWLMIAKPGG